ncbi:hypothetical protein GCM10023205_55620 [Yinghuangia aomiensis]|uniref:Uncharacterized protein n=1 Tax=Yinghuangia aomiensis TaxID=676205 RepID=A0ABP9HWP0_9ACTN
MPDSPGSENPDGPPEFGENPDHAGDDVSSVVFDEHFVAAALVHEPSAAERMLASAPPTPPPGVDPPDLSDAPFLLHPPQVGWEHDGTFDSDPLELHEPTGAAGTGWWRQSVAWVLALLMGVGVVAMAVTAVAPGRAGNPQGPKPTVGPAVPGGEPLTSTTAPATAPAAAVAPVPCVAARPPAVGCS